ncbi:GNAT family acetyltransferase [Chitinilyticum piscinae]|uniref:GNAT family acetyltransferase n=1 Tax=Chitinilyticum piscinae TaxID=2866724 RepID=A0A8J7FWD9_9NEIS|nr:GNAT family acetyltransferase [Chitinilyticum piscinae]MBE9608105.1 GNAT family acetyltransferase [Chitinilyticum piscinae]
MKIRNYQHSDLAAVLQVWEVCRLLRSWSTPEYDIAMKMAFQPDLLLLACVDERVVGTVMAGYDGQRGWINYLGVLPDYQRRGIASALLAEAELRLQALGARTIKLQIRRDHLDVQVFYASQGYHDDEVVGWGKRLSTALTG